MPEYKLTYFNIRGLGEPIRFLFHYGGIEFEDIRLSRDDWPQHKSNYPFGQLPVLEYNGKVINQSTSIARYVGKLVKLNGKNDWEDLEIDAVIDTLRDLLEKTAKYYQEKNEEVKATLKETLFNETLPYFYGRLENVVKKTGYLALGRLTWADIWFVANLDTIKIILETDPIENYPALKALQEKVLAIPNIKAWVEKRPKTEF